MFVDQHVSNLSAAAACHDDTSHHAIVSAAVLASTRHASAACLDIHKAVALFLYLQLF